MKVGIARNWFDRMLVTFAACLALYSAGMSVTNSQLAWLFVGATILAAVVGTIVSKLFRKTVIYTWDGYLLAVLGLVLFSQTLNLNRLLPGEGFPLQLIILAWLCWLIVLGSLLAWRDATMLFLTLPCIAVFGLVGTFDTYPFGTALFFLFLVLVAVLYARVHQRSMLETAKLAGAKEPERLGRDAWKWVAGPEWALASAGVIIVLSLLGAPILQFSLRGVAGTVRLSLPQASRATFAAVRGADPGAVTVGNGPIISQSEVELFEIKASDAEYVRESVLWTYTGRGWSAPALSFGGGPQTSSPIENEGPNGGKVPWANGIPPEEPMARHRTVELELRSLLEPQPILLAPGPVTEVVTDRLVTVNSAGIASVRPAIERGESIRYSAAVPIGTPRNAALPDVLSRYENVFTSAVRVSDRVSEFAFAAARNARTDYGKALAIQRAISSRVAYNLKAKAVPADREPVDYFLFDSKEGYCDLFATAMATSARLVGLPSRYVIGYYIGDIAAGDNGFRVVKGKDYHAWAELYFEGVGWVPFDPTSGARQVEGAERGASAKPEPSFWDRDWVRKTLDILTILGLVAAGAYVFLAWRKPSLAGLGPRNRSALARLHAKFQRTIERQVRFPRRFSTTLTEFVELASPKLGEAAAPAREAAVAFEKALFGPAEPEKSDLDHLAGLVEATRKSLRSQRSRSAKRAKPA